jgi:hypothetical protein
MRYIKMSYMGFTLCVNPESISLALSKSVSRQPFLSRKSRVSGISRQPCVIKGKGILFGENAQLQANELGRLFMSERSAWLFSPVIEARKMFFTSLEIKAGATREGIEYSFEFCEDISDKEYRYPFTYTYALEGENLFDIASRCHIEIGELFNLNAYPDLFSVREGDKVWLK